MIRPRDVDALLDLAAMCEKATGPDRELDARIWCAINGKRFIGWFDPWGEGGRRTAVEYTEQPKLTRIVSRHAGPLSHAINYTSSIDAAMTLVVNWPGPWGSWNFAVQANLPTATTPALAICAAALRSRSAQS